MAVEFLPGNRLTLLRSGVEYFPALEAAIREARRELFVASYSNASDDMDTPRQKPPRYDYAVKVEGPLLGPIQASAVRLWNRIAMARLEHGARVSHPVPPHVAHAGSQHAALVVRDNLRHRRDI